MAGEGDPEFASRFKARKIMEYTDDNVRLLYAEGLSNTEMGSRLGVSRSAVAGKVKRLGLAGTRSSHPKPGVARPAPRQALKPNRNTIAMRPFGHKEMTKSEMQADLRKAVENTK